MHAAQRTGADYVRVRWCGGCFDNLLVWWTRAAPTVTDPVVACHKTQKPLTTLGVIGCAVLVVSG